MKKTKDTTKKEIDIAPTKTEQSIEIVRGNTDVLMLKLLSLINTNLVEIKLLLQEKNK